MLSHSTLLMAVSLSNGLSKHFEFSASIFEFSSGEKEAFIFWPLLGVFPYPD
jgi:hypothetical protein